MICQFLSFYLDKDALMSCMTLELMKGGCCMNAFGIFPLIGFIFYLGFFIFSVYVLVIFVQFLKKGSMAFDTYIAHTRSLEQTSKHTDANNPLDK